MSSPRKFLACLFVCLPASADTSGLLPRLQGRRRCCGRSMPPAPGPMSTSGRRQALGWQGASAARRRLAPGKAPTYTAAAEVPGGLGRLFCTRVGCAMTLSSASRSEPAPGLFHRLDLRERVSTRTTTRLTRRGSVCESVFAPGFKGSNWLVEPAIDALAAAAMMRPLGQIMF